MQATLPDWVYSPDPVVESAIARVASICPVTYIGGLERLQDFLPKIGNPHHKLPPVFHVAGTNGKGSTLAFLQAILEASGKRAHKYISPHLVRFEERIILNGRMIDRQILLDLIDECLAAAKGQEISFFEFFTALAFLAFSRTPSDVLLLETGMGGRLDATNVVEKDIVSIITRISFDHTHILGNTLELIAGEKAGIIKKDCPVIVAEQSSPAVWDVFQQKAVQQKAPLFRCGKEWHVRTAPSGFVYVSQNHKWNCLTPSLLGEHQFMNAGCAMAALEQSVFKNIVTPDVLNTAMQKVSWPGRMQRLTRGPLIDLLQAEWELWLDGAHNDSGAEVLAQYLGSMSPNKLTRLITMIKDGKDAPTFFKTLQPWVKSVTAVDVDVHVKMLPAIELCDHVKSAGIQDVTIQPNLAAAVSALISQSKQPQRIVIAGSLYLAGYVLRQNS